jgi:replication factor C small subunit
MNTTTESLTDKWRPRYLADLVGQPGAVAALSAFVADPCPCAFLFAGDTGTGKTSAAYCVARELGCGLEQHEFGGVWEIASGEQTADSVRTTLRQLWNIPFYSAAGWKVLIVNECDRMSPAAETVWLDALEDIPPHTVIIFSTNYPDKLSDRFADRCETVRFESAWSKIKAAVQDHLRRVWQTETGRVDDPPLRLCDVVENDRASFRRALQRLAPLVRKAKAGTLEHSLYPIAESSAPAASPVDPFDVAKIIHKPTLPLAAALERTAAPGRIAFA